MTNENIGRTRKFLQLSFQDYYKTHHDTVDIPHRIQTREFAMERWSYTWRCPIRVEKNDDGSEIKSGCGKSGESNHPLAACPSCGSSGIDITNWSRHLGFRSRDLLLNDLVNLGEHSIYHSAAFYEFPIAKTMVEKNWQGAELVFDIDADHLDISCAKNHDSWRCANPKCKKTGKGRPPEQCPKCGKDNFVSFKWLCEKCLDVAKRDTIKLHDKFLLQHFGINPEHIVINYSGHRGYHIRVNVKGLYDLDSKARSEIARYISGDDMSDSIISRTISTKGSLRIMPAGDTDESNMGLQSWQLPSIARKIADAMIEFIQHIEQYEGKGRWLNAIQEEEHKQAAIKGLERNPPILSYKVKGVGVKSWQEIAQQAIHFYGSKIDLPVTHDIHRVIRLIGSLNGKTGFTVNRLTRDQLDDFEPFVDAIAFTDSRFLKVKIRKSIIDVPQFRVGDEEYGPFNDTAEELPLPAAIFLMCKGLASYER